MQLSFVLPYIGIMIVSAFAVGLCWAYAHHRHIMDTPNERSSHQIKTARGGGMGFVITWLFALLYMIAQGTTFPHPVALIVLSAAIAGLGWWDDHVSLSSGKRFCFQMIFALCTVYLLLHASPIHPWLGWWWLPVLVVACVWSTNLFNFMDGTDGIATVEAICVLSGGTWLFYQQGAVEAVFSASALIAALCGFLLWNWPRAKIFMGDGGSGFLGFVIALFALVAELFYEISVWYWILLYSLFWFDATVTLLRRMLKGEPWTKPHCSHAYQRLHKLGWSHRRILLGVIGLNTLFIALAIDAFYTPAHKIWISIGVLVLLIALYAKIYVLSERSRRS